MEYVQMGLSALILDGNLATTWVAVLEKNGIDACRDQSEKRNNVEKDATKRMTEELWQIAKGSVEVRVLEVTYRDRVDRSIHLVFMPTKTRQERQLSQAVHEILVASGALSGVKAR
jgi:hypothetical protein